MFAGVLRIRAYFHSVRKTEENHERMDGALAESEKRYRTLAESAQEAIFILGKDDNIRYVNDFGARLFGLTSHDIAGKPRKELFPPPVYEMQSKNIEEVFSTGKNISAETLTPFGGGNIWLETTLVPMFDEKGAVYAVMGVSRDITERRRLESQLRHAQKMEAIGQLAGGIAHDFNNILTAIIGYGNIILMKMAEDDPQRLNVEHMLKAADRATHLTQNLLVFGRKQEMAMRPVNLNGIINTVEKLLAQVVGEDIIVKTILHNNSINVLADSGQMEQVLMNLAANARDAMPDGGTFTIATDVVELDDKFINVHGYGKPGEYVLMAVSDTGAGMDKATRDRIFEPFFTTKEIGRGTGLGLSIVYGIVKQHGGYIICYSELGAGTTFKIYIPLSEAPSREIPVAEKAVAEPPRGTETILLAEDEESIRKLIKSILEEYGYKVIDAADGEEAVNKFLEYKETIDLLLLDVIMPKMNGIGVYEEAKKIRPDVKLLMISGYSADFISKKRAHGGLNIIAKPISPTTLLQKIREELDK